jgi:hypothetical protein
MTPARWRTAALVLALAFPAAAQNAVKEPKPAPKPAAAPDQEAMMKAWTAYMTPGEPHARLAKLAGSWTTVTKSWMDPAQPPEETTGTCEFRMVLGGRYLEQRFEGSMMGQPYSGIGYTGFDNVKKKYEAYWIDSAGTGMLVMSGTREAAGKKTVYTGSMLDPTNGKNVPIRSVDTEIDDDSFLFELWMTGPDGKMAKSMEMTYRRKK